MENDNINNPEIDRVIHFLEYEINSKRSEATRSGWTTWAILGAIATLLWLMFSVLGTNESISWLDIFYITLLLSVSFDFLFVLNILLSSVGSKQFEKGRRFRLLDTSIGSFCVLFLLRTGALLIITHWISPKLNNFVEICCLYFLLINLTRISILLAFSYLQIPIPTIPKPKLKKFSYVIDISWFASGGIATIGLIGVIYSRALVPLIPEWRLGIIIFSLSLLILILFQSKTNSILLLQLDDIRRKLSLEQITLNRAKRKIDLILHGLAVSDVFQSEINDILLSLSTLQNIYEKLNSELLILEKDIGSPLKKLNKEDKTRVDVTFVSIFEGQKKAKFEIQTLKKNKTKLFKKINILYGMSKDIVPDIEKLQKELQKEARKLDDVFQKFAARFDKFQDKRKKPIKRIAQQPHPHVIRDAH